MDKVWVNGKFIDTSQPKASNWSPPARPEPKVWSFCDCGAIIFEGDSVWTVGEFLETVCFDCRWRLEGKNYHCDSAGLMLPAVMLEG